MPADEDLKQFCFSLMAVRASFEVSISVIADHDRDTINAISHLSAARDAVQKLLNDSKSKCSSMPFIKGRRVGERKKASLEKMVNTLNGFLMDGALSTVSDKVEGTALAQIFGLSSWHQSAVAIYDACKALLETKAINKDNHDLGLSPNGPLARFSAAMIHCATGEAVSPKTVFNYLQAAERPEHRPN
jgi:hypothetical protein